MKTLRIWGKTQLLYWPLYLLCVNIGVGVRFLPALALLPLSLYFLFKDSLDLVQGVGPIYWIAQLDPRWFSIGFGFMHELGEPWRKGKGIYIALCKRRLQIGLCRRNHFDEESGVLAALEGRYLDVEPKEIGQW